jgi:hypothetical protein
MNRNSRAAKVAAITSSLLLLAAFLCFRVLATGNYAQAKPDDESRVPLTINSSKSRMMLSGSKSDIPIPLSKTTELATMPGSKSFAAIPFSRPVEATADSNLEGVPQMLIPFEETFRLPTGEQISLSPAPRSTNIMMSGSKSSATIFFDGASGSTAISQSQYASPASDGSGPSN